jgi:hypothetical protein
MDIWEEHLSLVCLETAAVMIGGGTSEILKEILSKMIIDNKDYKPAVK